MATRQIPRNEWEGFFKEFTIQHQGWLVSIEILSSGFGSQIDIQNLPLESITSVTMQSGESNILIECKNNDTDELVIRSIVDVHSLRLKQDSEGIDKVLEIESSKETTLIRLSIAVRTALIDKFLTF